MGASRRATLAAILFTVLAVATIGAFAATRAVRSQDDILNTVELPARVAVGAPEPISFSLTQSDSDADVLIIDRKGDVVRSLLVGIPVEAGPRTVSWDGKADGGAPAPPGRYRLRVVLGDAGRSIEPPGSMLIAREGS